MKKSFTNPLTGQPCSRQRAEQMRNNMNGFCAFHADRPRHNGKIHCKQCCDSITAKRKAKSRQIRPSKDAWAQVDWKMQNTQIAKALGVSEASASYHRRKLALGVGREYTYKTPKPTPRRFLEVTHEQREAARTCFKAAVYNGAITQKPCAVCDDPHSEGHHFDYTRPLEVIWLCKPHHGAVHSGARQLI